MVLDQLKGVLKTPFNQFHADLEEVLGRPVWTPDLVLNYQGIVEELEGMVETPDTITIIGWADNTWEYLGDYNLSDYAHMSDDTFIMHLSGGTGEDQIEEYVRAFNRGEIAGYIYAD